jgi:CHAT domain-containing protein
MLAALAHGTYDVMHFAGHAFFEPDEPGKGGLLCADEEVLHGADLDGLSHLPALVFCNACEAARVRRAPARRGSRPAARWFASRRSVSGVGEAFLTGGVANFLGTHWPVGDASAFTFSGALYRQLLKGELLGQAVLTGRRQLAALPSLDWADYVHYGNPDFRLVQRT